MHQIQWYVSSSTVFLWSSEYRKTRTSLGKANWSSVAPPKLRTCSSAHAKWQNQFLKINIKQFTEYHFIDLEIWTSVIIIYGGNKVRVYVINVHFFAITERKFFNRNCQYFKTRAVSCVQKYFKKLLWERLIICPALQKFLDAQKKCCQCQEHFLPIKMNKDKVLLQCNMI